MPADCRAGQCRRAHYGTAAGCCKPLSPIQGDSVAAGRFADFAAFRTRAPAAGWDQRVRELLHRAFVRRSGRGASPRC